MVTIWVGISSEPEDEDEAPFDTPYPSEEKSPFTTCPIEEVSPIPREGTVRILPFPYSPALPY